MPVIVVTRLRLKDPALLDEFFTAAVTPIEQAQKSAASGWIISAMRRRSPSGRLGYGHPEYGT